MYKTSTQPGSTVNAGGNRSMMHNARGGQGLANDVSRSNVQSFLSHNVNQQNHEVYETVRNVRTINLD